MTTNAESLSAVDLPFGGFDYLLLWPDRQGAQQITMPAPSVWLQKLGSTRMLLPKCMEFKRWHNLGSSKANAVHKAAV